MRDAIEEREAALSGFASAAQLVDTWSLEVEGYRWDEPLVVQVWRKASGGHYAAATRPELHELLGTGPSADDAFNQFAMKFKLESKLWKA